MILNKSFVTERDIIVENSPVKNQVWKSTNSNNSKSMMQSIGSWARYFSSMRSICLWKFKSVAWILFSYALNKGQ